ncbi:MAG: IS1595 family transposase, partial [Betaproteobacteria bacterium]
GGGAAMKTMNKIVALVERGGGVRSMHVADVTSSNLKEIMMTNVHKDAHLMTDSSNRYNMLKRENHFAKYDQVNHNRKEYVRGIVSTNTVEGYFSLLKRGLNGIHHNVSGFHLHRYLAHYDFLYTNRHLEDGERVCLAIRKANGKRLMYKQPVKRAN